MPSETQSGRSLPPHWLLRRADQAVVAVLILAGLGTTVGWWIGQGGLSGRLIEVDRAEQQTAAYQVDINKADWPEFLELPGIGPTLAKRIVDARNAKGPFLSHEDLRRRVQGIGPKTLEEIRPYLLPIPDESSIAGK
jgi:competence protein ComEA